MTFSETYQKLLCIIFVGFAARVAVRCYSGAEEFWDNSYLYVFEIAKNIAAGNGVSFYRVPMYPAFLAAVTFGHKAFLPIVIAQSLIGAGTVLLAALLAGEIFGSIAAIAAATITALYPYYVVHDTALQETSLYTFFTALSVLLLLRARRSRSGITAACAGLTLGVAVMTRLSFAPFALLAPLWLAIPRTPRVGNCRCRRGRWAAIICASAVAVTVLPWVLTGSAVSSMQNTRYLLWVGNNPYTFSHYPHESIDRSVQAALEAFGPQEKAELSARDRWYQRRAIEYIYEQPWRTIANAFRKVGVSFGLLPSPRRGFWPDLAHSTAYGLVMTLGLWGMWVGRRQWREHLIFYYLFVSFAVVAALFYGHTSHRAYLDIYWIVFAAGVLVRWRNILLSDKYKSQFSQLV
jgi:4-amino-4-deoxy-L-arabinose transferase-like glycosyltransferase